MIAYLEDVILQTVCRILVPFVQLYGLYVIAHGHHSPGGGFQGGVILGSSFILLCLAYDINEAKKRMTEKLCTVYCSVGLIVYSGIGVICLVLGGNYLNYSRLARFLPVNPVEARSLGVLGVEIGVGITVMAVMVSLFLDLASGGEHEEGLR